MNRFPILDAKLRGQMRLEIKQLQKTLKTTALYVTHDQVEAMTLADRVVVLNKGRIEQVATPLELYSRPASLFVADFVGTYPMNFLRGTTSGADVDLASGARIASNTKITDPTSVVIGLRPEQLRIDPSGAIEFVPKIIEPLGSDTMIHGEVAGQPFLMRVDPTLTVTQDEKIRVSINSQDVHVFDASSEKRL